MLTCVQLEVNLLVDIIFNDYVTMAIAVAVAVAKSYGSKSLMWYDNEIHKHTYMYAYINTTINISALVDRGKYGQL